MLNKVLIAALLTLMSGLPGVVAAQDVPSGKWWYNKKVVQNLNLTQKEVGQLDRLYENSHRKHIDLKSAENGNSLNWIRCWGRNLSMTPRSVSNSSALKKPAPTWPTSAWDLSSVSGKSSAPIGFNN